MSSALQVNGVGKRFNETVALDDVGLILETGRVRALVGGNGSGKSTLIKILAGVHPADTGEVSVFGQHHDLRAFTPHLAQSEGLRFVHQDLGLFDDLTVAENFALAVGYPLAAGTVIARSRMRNYVRGVLERFQLAISPRTLVGALGAADRAMLAIARALHDDAEGRRVLVLDEPTASLPEAEANRLISSLRATAARGQAILFVGHKLREIRAVADDVTVLRDGRVAGELPAALASDAALIELIAGEAAAIEVTPRRALPFTASTSLGPKALEVRGLSSGGLREVTFTCDHGEILGICGLVGSGRTTLLRTVCGQRRATAGTVAVEGQPVRPTNGNHAVGGRIAVIAEDRVQTVFADLTVRANLSMATIRRFYRHGLLRPRLEKRLAASAIARFGIRTNGDQLPTSSLSGGNQQKVVLARALQTEPSVLLLDEPTIGVDVVARAQIHQILRDSTETGVAIVVVSSDLEELAQLCDRVLILTNGRFDGEVRAPDITPNRLLDLLHSDSEAR